MGYRYGLSTRATGSAVKRQPTGDLAPPELQNCRTPELQNCITTELHTYRTAANVAVVRTSVQQSPRRLIFKRS